MKITKHSFKPVPKRFHQSIENAVHTAKEGKNKAKKSEKKLSKRKTNYRSCLAIV